MKGTVLLLVAAFVSAMLFACAPKAVPAVPAREKSSEIAAAVTTTGWEAEWERVLKEAKKEGKVVIYCIEPASIRMATMENFKRKYGIDVEFVIGSGSELASKLQTERRAGLYLGDIYWGGATTQITVFKPAGMLDPLKPLLILPEVVYTKNWFGGKHWYADKEEQYLFGFRYNPTSQIAINTELVKPNEIKTLRDLLEPKWKGNIVMGDPIRPGTTQRLVATTYANPKLGVEFLRALAKQEPVIVTDERMGVEWVARGKKAIALGLREAVVGEFRGVGAPIKNNPPADNPVAASGAGIISLLNRAPRPNAAKVFVNWFLGKEMQTIYSKTILMPSARIDVPTGHIDPESIPQPGAEYIYTDNEEFLLGREIHEKIAKEIFGHLIK